MKVAKCPNCGANITIDETKDAGLCEFCNTPFVTDKVITQIGTSNNAQTIINNYYTTPSAPSVSPTPSRSAPSYSAPSTSQYGAYVGTPPRPKVNILIAIILFYLYIIPGFIYLRWVKKKQKEWDERNAK